jgi:hypothetical protein
MASAPSKRGLGPILKWSIRKERLRTPMESNIKAPQKIVKKIIFQRIEEF